MGTFTQNWLITYDSASGEQHTAGPTTPQNLYQAGVGTNIPVYDPTRFWTVDVQIPVTYSGGLAASCPFWWNKAIITGQATVLIENLQASVNGVQQNYGTVTLGNVAAFGVAFDPCSVNPPVAGKTVQSLEFWITNTQAFNDPHNGQCPLGFCLDLQKKLSSLGLGLLSSFTLSVAMTETVTMIYTSCGSPSQGSCSSSTVDQNSAQLKYAVPWNPPSNLTTQATTTVILPTQTFGCQGATCTLSATATQTITGVSSIYTTTTAGTTYTVGWTQTASTWTTGIVITVTQITSMTSPCTGANCNPPNNGNLLLLLALLIGVFIVGAAFIVTYTQRRK